MALNYFLAGDNLHKVDYEKRLHKHIHGCIFSPRNRVHLKGKKLFQNTRPCGFRDPILESLCDSIDDDFYSHLSTFWKVPCAKSITLSAFKISFSEGKNAYPLSQNSQFHCLELCLNAIGKFLYS